MTYGAVYQLLPCIFLSCRSVQL